MSPIARRRPVAAALASFGVVLASLAAVSVAAPVQANPAGTGLVISEVYGGGGNGGAPFTNDFIELYNPTAAPISVAGWSVQYRSATGTSAALTNLAGSVPAGGHYLIQEAAGATPSAPLPTPDATGTLTMSGTNGVVLLVANTTAFTATGDLAGNAGLVDMVGFGTTPTSFETANTGVVLTNSTSAARNAAGADTDHNANDFTEGAPTPTNSVVVGGDLTATDPSDVNAFVGQAITPINLEASGGTGPYTWEVTGLPADITESSDGVISGTPSAPGNSVVTATVSDSLSDTDAVEFSINVLAEPAAHSIAALQGSTDTSPFVGETVTTEGVVTAKYPGGAGSLNGIYIQTAGSGGSTNDSPGASDAIFVFGNNSQPAGVEIGDSVEVTGEVSEFFGLTEITPGAGGVVEVGSLGTVTPRATVPGTDCALPGTACLTGAALNEAREAFEGELFQPTADYTVTDVNDGSAYNGGSFSSSFFGEIGLAANSDIPLVTPTEVIDAQATADINARKAYNDAHRLVLDDGAGVTYWNTANTGAMDQPFPWFTETNYVRVGAAVTFPQPVVMEFRNSTWKLQPQTKVTDDGSDRVAFEQDRPATPEDVGGDLKLAAFNVLNYFTTLGVDVAGCSSFPDRQGNPIAVNSCPGNGPRGAWNQASFDRQESKIVESINTMDADIMALEEIENSGQVDGGDRDEAVQTLVAALNADAGSTRWAFVDSPTVVDAGEDVIRSTFIYNPNTVELVGDSELFYDPAFSDAREPFAQTFKALGADDADGFAMIANHFKSKGSGTPDPDGQGNANDRRMLQATALVGFAEDFAAANGVDKVFLSGDFNSYSKEDPVQILEAAGYISLESTSDPDEETYNFDGAIGSLDHIFANEAAEGDVSGVDIWTTNGYESQYYEYSRFNYNIRPLYAEGPFRASDHNPEIVGINTADVEPATKEIQILGTNDFHGRLENNPGGTEAGAAVLAGAVKQLRQANPNTVFAAAGDLIGASTFTSFIQNDKPTIDALNEAGLEVSAVGNHELDQGYDDLINRVMAEYDATTNPEGGAEWEYIAANLQMKATGDPAVPATFLKSFGTVDVGFVGAVTEELPSLVSPAGIADIEVTDIVDSVNEAADDLVAGGADVVVMLVHEGAPSTNCATMNVSGTWADIINNVNPNVDAIISGHTHLAYNCSFPVAAWSGRAVTERPVVSSGQYGSALNQLVFTVDTATGDVTAKTQALLNLKTGQVANYPADGPTAAIVAAAVAAAGPAGAVELGQIAGPFSRAKFGDGARENRGGESTLGNLVAEVQRWATESPESGAAQIAFMNPGGLRADMVGVGTGAFPRTLTYRQAADVQPFANTLVNMDLTGANIKLVLEQQWQRTAGGQVPTRPFLKLGVSEGFEYTYDAGLPEGSRITSMILNGEPIDPTATYSVTVNSFLASGGDNFRGFTNGTSVADTGKIDLQAMVDYMAEFANPGAGDPPLPVDLSQRAVGALFPSGDDSFAAGATAEFDLSSLIMTGSVGTTPNFTVDPKDAQVTVSLDDGPSLGSFNVDQTIVNPGTGTGQADAASNDEAGKADVSVVIPGGTAPGDHVLTIRGATTGTEVEVPITVSEAPSLSGVVRNAANETLAGVCVYLYTSENAPSASYATCTQADGSYYVGGIVPGEYVVAVSDPAGDYETLWVEEPVDLSTAVTGLDLVMSALSEGIISGTVTASNGPSAGGPVANICVFAYEADVSGQASYASCTGSNGNYALNAVDTGSYDVAFFDPAGVYATKWWTGTVAGAPTQAGAVAVAVTDGGTTDVDARLSIVTTGSMTGVVTDQNDNPVGGVCVYVYQGLLGGSAKYATCTAADGTWSISGMKPATNYRVAFSDPAGNLVTQWYKNGTAAGSPTRAGGSAIVVKAGQTKSGINAKMKPVP